MTLYLIFAFSWLTSFTIASRYQRSVCVDGTRESSLDGIYEFHSTTSYPNGSIYFCSECFTNGVYVYPYISDGGALWIMSETLDLDNGALHVCHLGGNLPSNYLFTLESCNHNWEIYYKSSGWSIYPQLTVEFCAISTTSTTQGFSTTETTVLPQSSTIESISTSIFPTSHSTQQYPSTTSTITTTTTTATSATASATTATTINIPFESTLQSTLVTSTALLSDVKTSSNTETSNNSTLMSDGALYIVPTSINRHLIYVLLLLSILMLCCCISLICIHILCVVERYVNNGDVLQLASNMEKNPVIDPQVVIRIDNAESEKDTDGQIDGEEGNTRRSRYRLFDLSLSTPTDAVINRRKHANILEVQHWLHNQVSLPQYFDVFVSNGYESMMIIKEIMDETELVDIGIESDEHRMRILKEIGKWKELHLHTYEENQKPKIIQSDFNMTDYI